MWKSADAVPSGTISAGEWLLDKQTHQRLQLLDPKGILRVSGGMKSRQAEAVHGIKYNYDQEYQRLKSLYPGQL